MYANQASVLENKTHKLLRDFGIQKTIRPMIIKKKTCKIVNFAVPADHRVELKESETKDKYLDLAWD